MKSAFKCDFSLQQIYNFFTDGQTNSAPLVFPAKSLTDLPEFLENKVIVFLIDSNPGISNMNNKPFTCRDLACFEDYSRCFVSMIIVTGPSLIRLICIMAPKAPHGILLPESTSICLINASYNGSATSGRAARI